jgi:hypothetical protein
MNELDIADRTVIIHIMDETTFDTNIDPNPIKSGFFL